MITNVEIEVNEAIKASEKTTALRCNNEETIMFQTIDEFLGTSRAAGLPKAEAASNAHA